MSVVAYRDGVLAADSRAYGGKWCASPGAKRKIHRLEDGTRIGITSGIVGMPERFLAWLAAGADPKAWGEGAPDLRALIIKPGGEVFLVDDGLHFSGPIECEFYAIGSGGDFALGAMAAGMPAREAVGIACQFDQHCGGPVTVLHEEP